MIDLIVERWQEALHDAYRAAKAEKLTTLRGKYVRRFDSAGLHPFSELVGKVYALEGLDPMLFAPLGFSPVLLREVAEQDAYDQFVTEVRDGVVV